MIKQITIISNSKLLKKKDKFNREQIWTLDGNLKHINRDKLAEDYIDFVGELNKKYNSVMWWAGSISSKNQYVSKLYKNICDYIEIIERIKHSNRDNIFITVDDKFLIRQLKVYCKQKKIKCIVLGRVRRNIVKPFLRSLVTNLITISYGWKHKRITEKNLGKQIRKRLKVKDPHYILRTWVDDRSFDVDGQYKDIYYGGLVDYIQNKNLIILCVFLSSFEEKLAKIKENNLQHHALVIPFPFFIKYFDYLKVIFLQWKVFFQLNKKINVSKDIEFNRYNVYFLIKQEIINKLFDGKYRNNLLYYYAAKNVGREIKCGFYAFPYENQSWEKLTILALKKYSPDTWIVGYQHSSISKMVFNYFLCKDESNITPLPHRIITVGSGSRKIMIKFGRFPTSILRDGCALRYEYIFGKKIRKRKRNKKILVPLTIDLGDSIALLRFLLRVFSKNPLFSIIIKCHPLLPIGKILSKGKLNLPDHFEVIENRSIGELLEDTDILLYTDTTVCMEAIMLGVPVIFIDIDNYYNRDRLFDCDYLKWSVRHEDELIKKINNIYSLNDLEFKKRQRLARNYMKNYFLPVTDERMKEFIKR